MLEMFKSKTFVFGIILAVAATVAWLTKGIDSEQWKGIMEWIMVMLGIRGTAEVFTKKNGGNQ